MKYKSVLASILTAIVVIAALGVIVLQLTGRIRRPFYHPKLFFTIDDGRTWFADDASKIPPFEKDGKTAYMAFVWTCDGGKTKFVSHVQRNSADGIEIKPAMTPDEPGNWVSESNPRARQIRTPHCPDARAALP